MPDASSKCSIWVYTSESLISSKAPNGGLPLEARAAFEQETRRESSRRVFFL